jgi:hypothetical protein
MQDVKKNRNGSNLAVLHDTPYGQAILLSDGNSCRVVPGVKKSYFV